MMDAVLDLMRTLPLPALILFAGGLGLPFVASAAVRPLAVTVATAALLAFLWLQPIEVQSGYLTSLASGFSWLRLDALSSLFTLAFVLAAFVYSLFSWDTPAAGANPGPLPEQAAALAYAGASVGAVLAGDLLTFFVWWELTALTSVLIVWLPRQPECLGAGLRYLLYQLTSGTLLLIGIVMNLYDGGSLEFTASALAYSAGAPFILAAFAIKAGFPLLHSWILDAYPRAWPSGVAVLSMFTTKMAIYALLRGFPGEELLLWGGALGAAFFSVLAMFERVLPRLLSYALCVQMGIMLAGVGAALYPLAIAGVLVHSFSSVFYQSLLAMGVGATSGQISASDRRPKLAWSDWKRAWRRYPSAYTAFAVGAATIAGMPLTSGFVSKSLTMAAVGQVGDWQLASWLLLFASVAVVYHSGLRPICLSLEAVAADSDLSAAKPSFWRLAGMFATAAVCIFVGLFPQALYSLMPAEVLAEVAGEKAFAEPYALSSVAVQLGVAAAGVFAFGLFWISGLSHRLPRLPDIDDFFPLAEKIGHQLLRVLAAGGDWGRVQTPAPLRLLGRRQLDTGGSSRFLAWVLAALAIALWSVFAL